MKNENLILALDQGTTSSRAILINRQGQALAQANREFRQIYPRPGWVEHDPEEIWSSQLEAARQVLKETGTDPARIAAIGITNQRETTLLWERATGRPLHNAIVWQCRRTADYCSRLIEQGLGAAIQKKTGLVVDAYFSGSKLRWLLENVEGARERAARGELCFGTVDSWLLYKLSGGKLHLTDDSNASRTMLYNVHNGCWDPDLLKIFGVPEEVLPEVRPTSAVYGQASAEWLGREIPVASLVGDQQAALFGQCCFEPGSAKNTYGTGCFLLLNTGDQPVAAERLLTTVAWSIDGQMTYALEGSVFIAGAAIQWLRDELKIIQSAAETEAMATSVADNAGVYFVPAFVGLGAPHWDMYARGTIVGLTRGTGRNHLARAALESIAYQTRDVLHAMEEQSGIRLQNLRVDGGAAGNNFLCQFQADVLGVPVERPRMKETTALGAACLAGLAVGFWKDLPDLSRNWQREREFQPAVSEEERRRIHGRWQRAVERALAWEPQAPGS